MVNLLGKRDNGLAYVKKSLEDNLNIIASDSRLKTITDKIADSRYLIKDLSTINLTSVSSIFNFEILDGKIFCFATSSNPGVIEVRGYQSDILLTTINTGGNQASSAFTWDNTYVYIGAIKGTTKSMYIQRYNRCTLAYVDEYLLYTNASPAFLSMAYKAGYIYAACAGTVDTSSHRIRKWDTTTLSTVRETYFNTPTRITLTDNGIIVGGRNATTSNDDLQKVALLSYTDLSIIQLFPKTTLAQSNWRASINVDDDIFICNDAGILAKYNITNNTILEEKATSYGTSQVRAITNIKNLGISIADSYGRIYIYDYDLNLLKYVELFPVSSGNVHALYVDNNNTMWYHSYQYPKVYKKQFIDLTEGII